MENLRVFAPLRETFSVLMYPGWGNVMKWKEFFTPVKSMDAEEARTYMAEHEEGTYTLLDVRQPGEYESSRIPGATLIPLPQLSDRIGELDPEKPVITY